MSSGVFKKLARARETASAAGFMLAKLEARLGDQFGEGLRIQVKQAINECRQQGAALMSVAAKNAVEAEQMHTAKNKEGGAA